ncbi:MAG: hypothetical protein A2513_06915 [Sulfurimonas sp. RIFOXYD12_FULL_33_39]|uniref:glycosyltransferase family 4 protein n=1 Tax=unclassified Sulfurimonas TaxID=2623549 RepID=UPI0008D364D2|nr:MULTISPECIES: glycosyltransferase family 4 protein [unclassified Sulfurimonas]OHE10583.1 MAG: hypothetical protein A2513_06915 [Sulfurimonas sp. RIFOXYD12_FULL_33_39]OHE15042.1 MAG: hypothetical protein A2530_01105 [Sulfurimonas sp. RIFOXYD2_FULL_34_21]DAB28655.1 MAG TPA: glycosyl transferase-like protein [Sulfurimonas sp. UBA10385]
MHSNTAIYYHPEAYSMTSPKLMGRNAAGESFLKGFFKYSTDAKLWAQVMDAKHLKNFEDTARAYGRDEEVKGFDSNNIEVLSQIGTLYYPGPDIAEQAFKRTLFGDEKWSICGITHTTSSARAMDAITSLITAPVQPWDAVICTSRAVKKNVEALLQAEVDYLKHRLGITKIVLPQLPVIPLGIHTKDFKYSAKYKKLSRKELGIDDNAIAVLYVGRLSFHAKANPFPMYKALQDSTEEIGKKVVLVECGWFANDYTKNAFKEASRELCPSVEVIRLDGREAKNRDLAWSCADIFCSFSDNIQETFGIVPIEAMAAGLPVVVSDWDGYKDTVRDGIDGFRVSTIMPNAGLGTDLAVRHALGTDTYDMYCGQNSSLVAVDTESAAEAFIKLFNSKELRMKMGKEGKKRAKEVYDWSVIIPQYEALWKNLHDMREKTLSSKSTKLQHPWPARIEPLSAFVAYPTYILNNATEIELTCEYEIALKKVGIYKNMTINNYVKVTMLADNEAISVFNRLKNGSKKAIEAVEDINEARKPYVFRSLVWLMKVGVIRIKN